MTDAKQDDFKGKETTARWVRKTKVSLLLTDLRQPNLNVSCRDVNQVFLENPFLLNIYNSIVLMRFFDAIYAKVDVDGKEVDTICPEPINVSSRYFMPGRGQIYIFNDVKDKDDELSRYITAQLAGGNFEAGFLENTSYAMIRAELDKGDRILDESEILDLGQKTPAPTQATGTNPPIAEDTTSPAENPEDDFVPDIPVDKKKLLN